MDEQTITAVGKDWAEHDATAAPGELQLVRSFLSLHEHQGENRANLPPTAPTLEAFMHDTGLMDEGEHIGEADVRALLAVWEALRARVLAGAGRPVPSEASATIERAAKGAGLELRFPAEGEPVLEPTAGGVDGAIGRLLVISFLAELDGEWDHLKECGSESCISIFYDRSRNHSGRWCSMETCGNRAKVRAFRERQRARAGAR
jgi:hypothetical protein